MIEQLTKFQLATVKILANSRTKVYCCPSGLPSDAQQNDINLEFNQTLGLVEMGLAIDASDYPKFSDIMQSNRAEGRDCVVIVLSRLGQRMFERVRHERWIC